MKTKTVAKLIPVIISSLMLQKSCQYVLQNYSELTCGEKIQRDYKIEKQAIENRNKTLPNWAEVLGIQSDEIDSQVEMTLVDTRKPKESNILKISTDNIGIKHGELFYYINKYCMSNPYLGIVWRSKVNYNESTIVKFKRDGLSFGLLRITVDENIIYDDDRQHNSDSEKDIIVEYKFEPGEHLVQVDYRSRTHLHNNGRIRLIPNPYI